MRPAVAVALGLAACGGSPAHVAEPLAQPPVAKAEAQKGATELVTSVYESIGHGRSDDLMTLSATSLVVFGPRRGDALANRSDALVALGAAMGKAKTTVASSALQVEPSAGGHSAWAFDVVDVGGRPLAVTAVLSSADDMWLVDAAALARTPTAKVAAKELALDAIVPPGLTGAATKVVVDGAARVVADKFQRGLADQASWGEELAARASAVLVGPMAGEVTRGKKDIKHAWKKRLEAGPREVLVGELAGAVTRDGRLAWISAPVTRTLAAGAPLPLRVFAVYARSGDDWKLAALQESLAIDEPGAAVALLKKSTRPTAVAVAEKPAAVPVGDDDEAPAPRPKKLAKKAKPKKPPDDGRDLSVAN